MSDVAAPSRLSGLVDYARREPGKCLAVVLALHLVIWTVLPALLSYNLQLDLVEDLALGREWQLGYWKHPPLPWWMADLAYRITGTELSVYLLGPLCAVACMYVVWLLGRDIVGGFQSLIAVAALEGIHFFNFSVPKFAHDQMQLPFWALTGLFLYRGITRGRVSDWLIAGAALALCFWSKYAAFALAGSLGAVHAVRSGRAAHLAHAGAVADGARVPRGDRAESQLADRNRLHADALRRCARQARDALVPRGELSAAVDREPALLSVACDRPDGAGAGRRARAARPHDDNAAFARRYVTMLALGPFAVTTAVALVAGRLPVAMWGYPLWSFAPLAALLWLGPVSEPDALNRFAAGFPRGVHRDAARLRHRRSARARAARPPEGDAIPRPRTRAESHAGVAREVRNAAPLCGRRRVRHQQHRGLLARQTARDRARRRDAQPVGRSRNAWRGAAP